MTRLIVLAMVLASVALGQPTISGYSGGTISGTGFGAGATIITWDDFDSSSSGTSVEGLEPIVGPTWDSPFSGSFLPRVSGTMAYSGDLSARVTWNDGLGSSNWASYFGWTGEGPYSSIYFTYQRYLDGDGLAWDEGSINHKTVYLFGNDSDHPQITVGATMNGGAFQFSTNGGSGWAIPFQWQGDEYFVENSTINWDATKGRWQRWEVFTELNEPYSSANDKIQLFHNQRLLFESDERQLTEGGLYDDFRIGHMDNSHSGYEYLFGYFDDIYVATGRARVEVGNASTFDDCTKRDIQVFSAWSATSIAISSLRTPSFGEEDSRYLFVVDEDGAASAGYHIDGSGGSVGTPDIQSATRSGTNAVLSWSTGDDGPYTAWLAESGVELQSIATSDTSATIPIGTGAIDVTVQDGTTVRRANIAEAE